MHDLEALKQLPGWRTLLGLFPVVFSTPSALARWLPPRAASGSPEGVEFPSWPLVLVDDASALTWPQAAGLAARAGSGVLVVSGGPCDFGAAAGSDDRAQEVESDPVASAALIARRNAFAVYSSIASRSGSSVLSIELPGSFRVETSPTTANGRLALPLPSTLARTLAARPSDETRNPR